MNDYNDVTKENINRQFKLATSSRSFKQNISNKGSVSGKPISLLNVIQQKDYDDYSINDEIYLYFKNWNEVKTQYLAKNERKKMVLIN